MSLKMIKLNIKQALICMVVLSFDLDVSFTKKRSIYLSKQMCLYICTYKFPLFFFKTITLQILPICRQILFLIFPHCYINISLCLRYRYETCNKHFINYTDFFNQHFFPVIFIGSVNRKLRCGGSSNGAG